LRVRTCVCWGWVACMCVHVCACACACACVRAWVRACVRACVCVCVCVCVRARAVAPTNEVAEVTDEAECKAYERTYCTPRPISGGFVGRSATTGCSAAASEMRSPAASAFALPEGPPRRADERAPIHCPAEDHDGLFTQAAPHSASGMKAARPRPKRASARFPQPMSMDRLPKCSAQFAERCLGVRASLRTSAGRPTGKHRLHCTSVDPAVRNAAGCGPSQRRRLLARGSGKYLHQPKCSACSRRKARVCGQFIRMRCIAPLRQTQIQSSTRGLISIARRRSRHYKRGSALETAAQNSNLECAVGTHCRKSRRLHRIS
jgi:hypothetical protein